MNKIIYSVLIILISSFTFSAQEWFLDLSNAQQKAIDDDKNIVLVFSGSDWCGPCIKLEKEIWETEKFKTYAKENLVMLRADFPRKKVNKLSKEQEIKNSKLAEKYNPQGFFPFVLILSKNLDILGKTGYMKMTPQDYIHHLNGFTD